MAFFTYIPPILKYRCLAIAKDLAPVDTGNLRHNAIYLTNVRDKSFSILYDGNRAHYMDAVNSGKGQPAQRFFERAGYVIGIELQNYYNKDKQGFREGGEQFKSIAKSAQSNVLSTSQNNNEREWRLYESILKSKGANYKWR